MDNNTKWPLKHSNNYDPFYLFIIGRISLFETSHLANMLRAINRTKDAARRLELSGNIRRRRRPPCSRRIAAQRRPQRGWPFPSSPSPLPKSSKANRQSPPPPPGSSIHTQTRQKRGKKGTKWTGCRHDHPNKKNEAAGLTGGAGEAGGGGGGAAGWAGGDDEAGMSRPPRKAAAKQEIKR